jgi:hypothetical protein
LILYYYWASAEKLDNGEPLSPDSQNKWDNFTQGTVQQPHKEGVENLIKSAKENLSRADDIVEEKEKINMIKRTMRVIIMLIRMGRIKSKSLLKILKDNLDIHPYILSLKYFFCFY